MKMTVTRALNELKLLDKRINKKINETTFITATKDTSLTLDAKADFESITTLISNRSKLKTAIMASNATTKVTIGGKVMTVVEAIEQKDSIEYKKSLLTQLKRNYQDVEQVTLHHERVIDERLQALLEATFGKDGRTSDNEIERISESFKEQNKLTILDPINVKSIIEELSNEIDTFESEVDFVLSESNAITTIEV